MKPVVCFGELMLRLSPPGEERFFQSPVLRTFFGGSEANVAVGLAYLGTPAEYVTRLPENAVGDAALRALRAEGVGTGGIVRGGARLGVYYVEGGADVRPMRVVYDRAGSAFATAEPAEYDWERILAGAGWLHLSGITPALGEGPARAAEEAAAAARRLGLGVSVDLNYRPALWAGRDPRQWVPQLVRGCDVLVGNPGAAAAMLGVQADEGGDLRAAAARMADELGCAAVAVTRRAVHSASEHGWSAVLWEAAAGEYRESRSWRVRVTDRVGGGDSFAAGLIHARLRGVAAAEALEFATAASALKLTVPGDFNRVGAAEVEALLASRA